MNCAICYEGITATTGKVTLSCSHVFHLSCLSSWFNTQTEKSIDQSCPCCRHKSNSHEKIAASNTSELALKNFYYAKINEYAYEVQDWYNMVDRKIEEIDFDHSLEVRDLKDAIKREKIKAEQAMAWAKMLENKYGNTEERRNEMLKTWLGHGRSI